MNKIFAVMVMAGLLICPVAGYAQYDSSVSGSSESSMSEESSMQSNLSGEMSGEESAAKAESDIADQATAGNSWSQQTAAEQEDE